MTLVSTAFGRRQMSIHQSDPLWTFQRLPGISGALAILPAAG